MSDLNKTNVMQKFKNGGRFGFGLVLIAAGLIFFAGNFSLIPDHLYHVLTSWPMILVAVGVVTLFKGDLLHTVVLFAVAAFFLLPDIMPGWSAREIWRYWPLLLVFGGIAHMMKPKKRCFKYEPSAFQNVEDYIDEVAVFGGRLVQVETHNFRGGKITAVFGGSEIDFGKAKLSDQGAVVEMSAVFGGAKLRVPRDWNVKVDVVSVFGGFTDKRLYPNTETMSSKLLVIKGVAVFGGAEIVTA